MVGRKVLKSQKIPDQNSPGHRSRTIAGHILVLITEQLERDKTAHRQGFRKCNVG